MTILVTGGGGFIGSAVVRELLHQGQQVRVLLRPTSDRRNLAGLAVETAIGDLKDPASLAPAMAGCTALFHVAADYRLWVPHPDEMYLANVTGTENILRAAVAAGVKRVVYTSSVATLGLPGNGQPGDETTPVTEADMIGHYKRSKFRAETVAAQWYAEHGLEVVIVNPTTPVGPRDRRPTPTGRMILNAVAGRMPAYVDTGLNIVHVDDVAQGHWLAFSRGTPGERYVLGGENLALRDILQEIARLARRPPPRVRLPRAAVLPVAYLAEAWAHLRQGHEPLVTVDGVRLAGKHMFFSSAKAQHALGYQPRPALVALEDAVRWFTGEGRDAA